MSLLPSIGWGERSRFRCACACRVHQVLFPACSLFPPPALIRYGRLERAAPQRRMVRLHDGKNTMIDIHGSDEHGQGHAGDGTSTGLIAKTRPATRKPSLYKVLMLNDDYTPMEFVVHVLERFFQKTREEATQIMLHVHRRGVGVCGVFTYEVAETKVTQVMDLARHNQHPLQCTIEKE
ncbi:ATP-dependent Clp protease adaptor protein ClpS [Granulibacter bethesdensis]|nr:ATP-dependent Clp protease adaptor protein ClpS [Granulibacter bethesdensis]